MQLLESRHLKRRRSGWKKYAVLVLLATLAIGAWKGWKTGKPRYLQWKQNRALEQAKAFIEKRDAPNAQLALDVALKTIPGNPDVIRVAADMLEQVGAPQAMRFRRAVVQLQPGSAEDSAKLVLCCLKFRDFNAARDALSTTPADISSELPMLHAALAFAISTDNSLVADVLLAQLREKSPNDESLKHRHAVLRLRHPQDARRLEARSELQQLASTNPSLALVVNRELAKDALHRRDYDELKRRQKLILADARASFSDRLQKANVELLIDHQPFDPLFVELAALAGHTEADALQFVQWLLVQNRATEADQWLNQLPEAFRRTNGITAVHAEVVSQLGDWDRLASLLEAGAWGPVPIETIRLAMAAHTIDRPNRPALRRETWDMTIESTATSLVGLRVLQRLAAAWRWSAETERTLWAIARTFPEQTWAHQSLFNLYKEREDTKSMRDVMAVLKESERTVPRYQHDWALLTLLVTPTATWNPAKDEMRQLYEMTPTDANHGTGYAFALAQAGRAAEALSVLEKMSDQERQYPPRQPYFAFVYGVGKKAAELDRCIAFAEGVKFLPEERYLFTRAQEELARKPAKPTPDPSSAGTAQASAEP